MRDTALRRLIAATSTISTQVGVPLPVMPEKNRDPDYHHAAELMAVAVWAEGVAEGLTAQLNLAVEGNADGSHSGSKNKTPRR